MLTPPAQHPYAARNRTIRAWTGASLAQLVEGFAPSKSLGHTGVHIGTQDTILTRPTP